MHTDIVLLSLTLDELKQVISDSIRKELEERPTTIIQQPLEEQLLSRDEAAKLLKISLVTLNDRMRKGEIPFSRSGRRILFLKSDLIKMLTENKQ